MELALSSHSHSSALLNRYESLQSELKSLSSFIFGKGSLGAPLVIFERAKSILELLCELKAISGSPRPVNPPPPPLVKQSKPVSVSGRVSSGGPVLVSKSVGMKGGASSFSIFVDNLPLDVNFAWLGSMFKKFGVIVDVYIPKNCGRNGRRFGFVRFKDKIAGLSAIQGLNGKLCNGSVLDVSWAKFDKKSRPRPWARKVSKIWKWVPKANQLFEGAASANGHGGLKGTVEVVADSVANQSDGGASDSSNTITNPIDGPLTCVKPAGKLSYKDVLLRGHHSSGEDSDRTISDPLGPVVEKLVSDLPPNSEVRVCVAPKGRNRKNSKKVSLNLMCRSKWSLVKQATSKVGSSRGSGPKKGVKRHTQCSNSSNSEFGDDSNAESAKEVVDICLDKLDEEARRAAKVAGVLKMISDDQETLAKAFRDDLLEKKKLVS